MTRGDFVQPNENVIPLVMRVASFSGGHNSLAEYRHFIDAHLFPTLRTVPGYVGAFLGCDAKNVQLISVSFWRSEADAVAGEDAVGSVVRRLPPGSAPRPSTVAKFVVEFHDIRESFSDY